VSDSRMNSCRCASHIWPVWVRKSMPVRHSRSVGSISLMKACRCRTSASLTCRARAVRAFSTLLITAAVMLLSSRSRMLDPQRKGSARARRAALVDCAFQGGWRRHAAPLASENAVNDVDRCVVAVAAPGDDLIGPDQHQVGLVEIADLLRLEVDH